MYSPGFHKASTLRTKEKIEKELADARARFDEAEEALVELSNSGSQHGDAVERRAYLQSLMNSKFYAGESVRELEDELSALTRPTPTSSVPV